MIFQRCALFPHFFLKKVAIFEKFYFFVWHPIDAMKIHVFCFYNIFSGELCGQQSQKSIFQFLRGHKKEKFISPPRGGLGQKIFDHGLGVGIPSK